MRFLQLLMIALAAAFAAAESELAHAMEVIYWYGKYETERAIFSSGPYWVAPGCSSLVGGRKCSFNEFASYLKLGRVGTPPPLDVITSNGKFNWQDKATVQSVANKLAGMADPGDASRLVMAGDVQASRVIPSYKDSNGKKINVNGIAALWRGFTEFNTQTVKYVKGLPDGDAKTNANGMLDFSENTLLKAANSLRSASSQQKLYNEMSKKFSTGKFDEVYKYTDADGKTKYYDPIKWNAPKTNIWGKVFQQIDLTATLNDNPQMRLNNDDLFNKVKAHKALFDKDGDPPGTGKGLLNWDPRFPTSNANHQFIIGAQKNVGNSYAGSCKK